MKTNCETRSRRFINNHVLSPGFVCNVSTTRETSKVTRLVTLYFGQIVICEPRDEIPTGRSDRTVAYQGVGVDTPVGKFGHKILSWVYCLEFPLSILESLGERTFWGLYFHDTERLIKF